MGSGFGVFMGGVGGVWRGLLLVGTGLRSLFMALLVFGVIIYSVFWGGLAFYAARRFGGVGAFLPEYVFFALFYGSLVLLAIKEYRGIRVKITSM
jgi:hypothetical protein